MADPSDHAGDPVTAEARRVVELERELAGTEDLHLRLSDAEARVQVLEGALAGARAEVEARDAELVAAQAERQALAAERQQVVDLRARLSQVEARAGELDRHVVDLEAALWVAETKRADLEGSVLVRLAARLRSVVPGRRA